MDGQHLRPHLRGDDLGDERHPALRQHRVRAAHPRRRPRCRLADGQAARRPPDPEARRLDRARSAFGLAARHGGGIRDVRRRRHLREAHGDPKGHPPEREDRQDLEQAADQARALAGSRVGGHPRPRRERAVRHRSRLRRRDPPERRQDRDDHRPRRRLVRRLHAGLLHGGLDGVSARGDPDADVHGQAVAGATFPVPIWHLYMEQAEKNRPAREFQTPSSYPTFTYFQKGYWGYLAVPVAPATTPRPRPRPRQRRPFRRRCRAEVNPGHGGSPPGPSPRRLRAAAHDSSRDRRASRRSPRRSSSCSSTSCRSSRRMCRSTRPPAACWQRPQRPPSTCPSFPASAMDGFALRAADAPATLPVVARIAAGRPVAEALEAGQAMAIATGGVVPDGADSVVPIEDVEERDGVVVVPGAVETGANVRPRGGDLDRRRPSSWQQERASARCISGALAAAGVTHVSCSPATPGRAGRHRDRASVAGRDARQGRDLRRERRDPRHPDREHGRLGRPAASRGGRRGRDPRRGRARPRRRRARDERRRLGRRLRPGARHRGRARRRGGLLARCRSTRQARCVRGPRPHARLRASRQPGLLSRRLRAVRAPCAACAAGPGPAEARSSAPGASDGRSSSSAGTRCYGRARGSRTGPLCSTRSPGRSPT